MCPWKIQMSWCSGPALTCSSVLFWGDFLILFSMGLCALSATGCYQLLCENWIQPKECRWHIVKNLPMVVLVSLWASPYLHAFVSADLMWVGSTWTAIRRALGCNSVPLGLILGSSSVSIADHFGNCELPLIRLQQHFPVSTGLRRQKSVHDSKMFNFYSTEELKNTSCG